MAKYKFVELKMPAYNDACWKTLRDESSTQQCASSYMVSHVTVGVSTPFSEAEPQVMTMFSFQKAPSAEFVCDAKAETNSIVVSMGSSKPLQVVQRQVWTSSSEANT